MKKLKVPKVKALKITIKPLKLKKVNPEKAMKAHKSKVPKAHKIEKLDHAKKPKGEGKIGKVMSEFAHKELHSGSKQGPLVTNPKQAIAIGMSEAGRSKKKKKSE